MTLVKWLFIMVALPLALRIIYTRVRSLEEKLRDEVERRGGAVLTAERMAQDTGPFFFADERHEVVKVTYRDQQGRVRQLWGRNGILGSDFDWEYDDRSANAK